MRVCTRTPRRLTPVPAAAGPDSPVSPLKELREVREVKELTYAMRRQQRALEGRLEACLEELRTLCLREAVSGPRSAPRTRASSAEPGLGGPGLWEGRALETRWGAAPGAPDEGTGGPGSEGRKAAGGGAGA